MPPLKNQTIALFFACLLSVLAMQSQQIQETQLYSLFDNAVGKENLSLYNGPVHLNFDITPEPANHRYFQKDAAKATVRFDGQSYFNIDLKYDILQDAALVQPPDFYSFVTLIAAKTQSFTLNGKTFVNLNYGDAKVPDFITGFYEQNLTTDRFIFYIKHHKDVREIIKNNRTYKDFQIKNNYILQYKNDFHEITSKSKVIALFPEYKSQINDFYQANRAVEKSDPSQFTAQLLKYIHSLSAKL